MVTQAKLRDRSAVLAIANEVGPLDNGQLGKQGCVCDARLVKHAFRQVKWQVSVGVRLSYE